ncbi:MAG: nuclear transport factor 2 family protein [Thermoanaerobaculia bacterium]|nr:nuclear transport factor 2 family protein [Thermoanaerobaculia bacterium]
MDSNAGRSVTEAVQHAFHGLAQAARALDHDRYFQHFDQAVFTALNADGTVTHSFEAFARDYRQQADFVQAYRSLDFHRVKITVIDAQTAVLVNEYRAQVILKSGQVVDAEGAGTQLWSRRTGTWKLVSVSSSAKPSSGAPEP